MAPMLARWPRQPAPSSTKTRCTCSPLVSCWTPRVASWSVSTPAALSAGSSLMTSSGSSATSESADPLPSEDTPLAGDRTDSELAFQEMYGAGRRDAGRTNAHEDRRRRRGGRADHREGDPRPGAGLRACGDAGCRPARCRRRRSPDLGEHSRAGLRGGLELAAGGGGGAVATVPAVARVGEQRPHDVLLLRGGAGGPT